MIDSAVNIIIYTYSGGVCGTPDKEELKPMSTKYKDESYGH